MSKVVKSLLVLLIGSSMVFSSAHVLQDNAWISSDNIDFSSILLQFENGTVHAGLRCINTRGNYTISGSNGLQMQIHSYDTSCTPDDPNLKYNEYYQEIVDLLNSIASFKIRNFEEKPYLYLITGTEDTLEFNPSDGTVPHPEAVLGKWYSVNSGSDIHFFDNGDFELFDGCNHNWGHYGIREDSLFLSDMSSTLVACDWQDVKMENPSSGSFSLSNDTLFIADPSQNYCYTRTSYPLTLGRNCKKKVHFQRDVSLSGDDALFDIKGRAIRKNNNVSGLNFPVGILLRRWGSEVKTLIHVSRGSIR